MAKMPDWPLDILAEELGAVAGRIERELRQGYEATIAKIDARIAGLELVILRGEGDREQKLAARLADLRNGVDGSQGERGFPGERGERGEQGERGLPGERGADGLPGERGERGLDGTPGRDGIDGTPGKDGRDGLPGQDGKDGAPGRDGAPGKLPVAKAWTSKVHYEGDVVTHDGSTYQAVRDTGGQPPGADWQSLAMKGADARGFAARGTFDTEGTYSQNDVVAFNGSSFIALKDDPGACPGEGWQLLASAGKRGKEGPPGREGQGKEGKPGKAGASLIAVAVEEQFLVFTDSEGQQFRADLTPVAEQILAAAR